MKNNPLSRVSASIPLTKKSKFSLSHDVNTTYDWGSVQPLFGKLMLPDSSINVNAEQLTRLAPMVVPTFGRVKLKNIAHFIPCDEIWPNWDAMMSQTKVTRTALNSDGTPTSSVYVPQKVPYLPNSILAAWCLAGASVNLYFSGTVGTVQENTWNCARNTGSWGTPAGWPSATTATREYLNVLLDIANTNSPATSTLPGLNYTGYTYLVRRLLTSQSGSQLLGNFGAAVVRLPTISTMVATPLANAQGNGYTHSASNEQNSYDTSLGDDHVSFDGSDLIWEYAGSAGAGITSADRAASSGTPVEGVTSNEFDGRKIRIVFRFSSFGKRMRKILIGLGYDVNLSNDDNVSILPLIAFYKAWWDTFAPERFKNFYETNAWKIINATMVGVQGADLLYWFNQTNANDIRTYFRGFMGDLGTCFATDRMDVISAATDTYSGATNTTTAGTMTSLQSEILTQVNEILGLMPTDVPLIGPGGQVGTTMYPGGQAINQVAIEAASSGNGMQLTQPQIDALKKAYIMMNKTSVAGMKVEEILRALGHGDYVEECKGRFINSTDDSIKISDVVATAATDDAELGQYGGRGLGLGKFQFSFSTNRYGYLVILSTMVPESGYVNAPVHENEAIGFDTMYNPELDGLAYEAIQKKQLTGSPLISDGSYRATFGFLPTYSQWKFMSNKANGDFSLNSRKQYMIPYTLDKYLPVSNANVYRVEETNGHVGSTTELCTPRFTYADLPNAGEDYRFINKFPWNGDFNRIFSEQDDGYEWSVFSPNNNSFLFNSFEYDNFMTHNVFDIAYFAHMKSIEDSYGTFDEEHGAPNSSISRS